jgi:nucleotide-binding universal stress UspA family protein
MFQHILIPTDGSELSYVAARAGIQLAKALQSRVTGFYAAPDYRLGLHEDSFPNHTASKEILEIWKPRADQHLGALGTLAKEAGVTYEGVWSMSHYPAQAIMQAAGNNECDLIFMASHGRKGVQGLLLGSVTQKVLTHCKIPVLVYR